MKRGFTLIELLVVMAIIGILAAAVLVVGYAAKQKARAVAGQGMITSTLPAMYMCLAGDGAVQQPGGIIEIEDGIILKMGGNYLCSDTSITDAVYPNLTGSYWSYDKITPKDGDSTPLYLDAFCVDPNNIFSDPCGNKPNIQCTIEGSVYEESNSVLNNIGCRLY